MYMRIGTVAAVFLFAAAAGLFVYSMVITSRIGSEVEQQGYRAPIQDQAEPPEIRQPLQKSNVPPPG
jgi:hypothetical protein